MRLFGMVLCGLALTLVASAQETIVKLTDASGSGVPFQSTGTCVLHQELSGNQVLTKYEYEWRIKNVSPRPILAMVGSVKAQFPNGRTDSVTERYEGFFQPHILDPGSTWTMSEGWVGEKIQASSEAQNAATPSCEIRITWVQFVDGTIYGNSALASDLVKSRVEVWRALLRLDDAYRTHGIPGLSDALQQPENNAMADGYIDHLRRAQRDQGPQFALQSLQMHIQAAKDHGVEKLVQLTQATN